MSKISFIYFDVGGVAIQDFSDSPKWDVMMQDMGLDKFDRSKIDSIYDEFENEVCIGKRHIDTLLPLYEKEYGVKFDPDFSMLGYFVDHFDPNPSIGEIIKKIKKTHQIGLLTDMYPGMLDMIFAKGLLERGDWDQIVDSSVIGLRKPMKEMYELATKMAGVPSGEILFIDNRQKNIEGAKNAGWQTFFYDSKDYLESSHQLSQFLNLAD